MSWLRNPTMVLPPARTARKRARSVALSGLKRAWCRPARVRLRHKVSRAATPLLVGGAAASAVRAVSTVGAGADLEVTPQVGDALVHRAPAPRAAPAVVGDDAQDAELVRIVDRGLDASTETLS